MVGKTYKNLNETEIKELIILHLREFSKKQHLPGVLDSIYHPQSKKINITYYV